MQRPQGGARPGRIFASLMQKVADLLILIESWNQENQQIVDCDGN